MCDKQRRRAEQRAERVAEHVVRLRKSQRKAILRALDPRAEQAAGKYCDADPPPVVPSPRQRIRERQPQREEEEDIHQHLAVELRLLPHGGEGGKGGEDEAAAAGRAGQDGSIEDDEGNEADKHCVDCRSSLIHKATTENGPKQQ